MVVSVDTFIMNLTGLLVVLAFLYIIYAAVSKKSFGDTWDWIKALFEK